MTPTYVAFDLYGTLLSTESVFRELANIYGEDQARSIASLARRYQLEYTWRANSMGLYKPFDELTRCSFEHATADMGSPIQEASLDRVMQAYNGLDSFEEIPEAIQKLKKTSGFQSYIFSNGTSAMVTQSVATSKGLSSTGHFTPEMVITVNDVKVYKPEPRAYRYLLERLGETDEKKVWLVSSNPFDVCGAAAVGLSTAWIDRVGKGWVDGLGRAFDLKPTVICSDVSSAVDEIKSRTGN